MPRAKGKPNRYVRQMILAELATAPEGGLSLTEIAKRCQVAKNHVSTVCCLLIKNSAATARWDHYPSGKMGTTHVKYISLPPKKP